MPDPRARLLALATVLLVMALPGNVSAQADDPKSAFVAALGRFSVAVDGAYGDEGRAITQSLDAMERGLHQWDAQIAAYEAAMAADLPRADAALAARMHLALGGVYLDRGRIEDGLRELTAAAAFDPTRADTQILMGIAHRDGRHDAAAAVDAFTRATALAPADPVAAYLRMAELAAARREQEAAAARRVLVTRTPPPADARPQAPFLRLSLIPEISGIEPFFPPIRYQDGYARLLRGDIDGAVARLRDAAAHDPLVLGAGAARGFVERAAMALRDGRVQDAVEQIQNGIRIDPEQPEPYRVAGVIFAAIGMADTDDFEKALRLAPADERAHLSFAQALVDTGQLAAAADALTATVKALPASGRARYMLARVHQRQGKYPEAIGELGATLAFNPMLGVNSIYDTIGALEASRQNLMSAIDAYRMRVALDPNNADAHQRLGDIYARSGLDEDAAGEFLVTLLLRPASPDAHAALAQLQLRAGDYDAAAESARRTLALDRDHRQARYALGTALVRAGKIEEGRAELATYQRLQADDAAAHARQLELEALKRQAALSTAANDYARAADLLRQAIASEPDSGVAHMELGVALARAGRMDEAIAELTRAASLGAPYEVHARLADAFDAVNRTADSARERALFEQQRQDALRRRAAGR